MMMCLLDRLPSTGDVSEWEQWRLEVVDVDGRRVDKVLASRLPDRAEPQKNADSSPSFPSDGQHLQGNQDS
jgi:putative hemolysin